MEILVLGVYLILVGLVQLLSIPVAGWVMGVLALIAGILLVLEASGKSPLVRR